MHNWTFILNGRSHKIQFWDSRISGKKKLALDGRELKSVKDVDNFSFLFQIDTYNFNVYQKSDEKYEIKINNKTFTELMQEERTGVLHQKKEEYLKKEEREKKKKSDSGNDYYKRAMKYNGDNYFEGEEDLDIEEQRRRLEEFEKKKKSKENKNNYVNNNENNNNNNSKKNFVLDSKTVNLNRTIICNLKNIFGNDFQDGGNLLELNWKSNHDNNQNSIFNNNQGNNNYDKKILDSNPDYYLNQMANNLNNAKNPHNQAVLDQFFDLTNNNNNNNNNINYNNQQNNNMNYNNQQNNNNYNMQFQNNNYSNQNNFTQNNQNGNNNYDDDFNPFDD